MLSENNHKKDVGRGAMLPNGGISQGRKWANTMDSTSYGRSLSEATRGSSDGSEGMVVLISGDEDMLLGA